jgi:hypothetical protein
VVDRVGTRLVLDTAFGAVGDGGMISQAGVPQYTEGPIGLDMLMRNLIRRRPGPAEAGAEAQASGLVLRLPSVVPDPCLYGPSVAMGMTSMPSGRRVA